MKFETLKNDTMYSFSAFFTSDNDMTNHDNRAQNQHTC